MSDIDFTSAGFFAGDLLTEKTIRARDQHGDFQEGSVWVKKLPAVELRRFTMERESSDPTVREVAGFRALAMAIRKEDGSAHMTAEGAKRLTGEALGELFRVFTEVHVPASEDTLGKT